MAVTITWATESGGTGITSKSWEEIVPGASATIDLYVRHDGSYKITDCRYYIKATTGYEGDLAELLEWGSNDSDGILINQAGPTYVEGSFLSCKISRGVLNYPMTLDGDSMVDEAGPDGEIAVGDQSHIKVKIKVPAAEDIGGARRFTQCMAFTYTS